MARSRNRPRQSSPLNLPSAFSLFSDSKEIVLKNIWIFGPLYAVPVIFWIHNWIWSPSTSVGGGHWWGHINGIDSNWGSSVASSWLEGFVGFSLIWLFISVVVGTISQLLVTIAAFEASEGRSLDFAELWQQVRQLGWRLIGLDLLVGLYVFVGLILFIIPGLIMVRRYFLASYVMIDRNCGIQEAMDRSAELSKPYSFSIWNILGVMFLIGLVSLVPLIGWLASLVLGMLYVVAPALRYQQLKKLA